MATKLYPPNIEGTIPAFSGTTMVVPFSLNRAVSKNEIAGFVVKIKTVQGSTLIGTIRQQNADYYDMNTGITYHTADYNRAIRFGLPAAGIICTLPDGSKGIAREI